MEKVNDVIQYDVIQSNLVQMIICTSVPEEDKKSLKEIEDHIQRTNPSGTDKNWCMFDKDGNFSLLSIPKEDINGDPRPCVPCNKEKGKFHYVLMC